MLLASAFLLDMDSLATYTPVGRVAIFDYVVLIFITILLLSKDIIYYRDFIELNTFVVVWISLIMFMLISGSFLSMVYNINFNSVIAVTLKYLLYTSLVFLLTNYLIASNNSVNFLKYILRVNFIIVAIGIGQILAINQIPIFKELFLWENIRGGGTRIAATFRWQGVLSLYLGITLPLVIGKIMESKKFLLYFFTLLFMVVIGFYSGSRSFIIVLIPSLSIFLIRPFIMDNFKVSISKVVIFGISLMALSYVFINYLFESRAIKRIFGLEGAIGLTNGISPRERIIQKGLKLWVESPFIGVGSGNLEKIIGEAAHNSYLEIIFENGIIGFMIFLAIIFLFLFITYKLFKIAFITKNITAISLAIIIINVHLYQVTASAVQYRILWIIYPLIFSLYYKLKKASQIS